MPCTPIRPARCSAAPRPWLTETWLPAGPTAGANRLGKRSGRYSEYHAARAHAVASRTWIHEYIPCDPSGLKITMIQVENPAIAAIQPRDCASEDITASGQV